MLRPPNNLGMLAGWPYLGGFLLFQPGLSGPTQGLRGG